MALFHLSVTQTKRSAGQSAIASAAYRAGERLYSEYYGEYSDYTRKGGVICSDILLPSHAPKEYADRQTLWNAVEKAERGKTAQLAYSFDIALQNEFSLEENIALARQFLLEQFVSRGMVVDFAVHQPDREDGGIPNPHFHVLCPIRPIEQNGKWGCKQHRVYELDEDGNRIRDADGNFVFNAVPTTDWGSPETLEYCRDISIKTRTSLDIKRRNGDFVGAFPAYGYMKSEENKNLLVPDPYASRVVQDIFRMRLDGTSALRIATVLNEMGILSPLAYKKNNGFPYAKHGYADKEDCKWSATTIIRILQDETYIGTLVQGKQGTPHYKIKQMEQRPSSEWIRVPDAHEPLIAKQDFELVQRIRRLDTRTSPKQDTVYLFSGVLICGCCGSRMTRKTNRVKGKEYHYYYCPTGKKHGCTNPVMLKESDLVECVKDSLKGYIDNVSCLQAILDGIDQSSINQALANEYASHIAANEQQVEQALEFKARLYESLITGTISKEEYTDYKARYTRIAENAKESIRVLKEKLADVLENRSERNRWISHFTQFSTMETLDRKAVVHMIQSIKVIGKKELEITFTYQDEYQKAIQLIQLAEQTSQRKVG